MAKIFQFIPIPKVRRDLSKIVRQLGTDDRALVITKRRVPAAVILSIKMFEGLLETLDILSDESTVRSLRRSIHQGRKGQWVRHGQVFGR